MKKRILKVFKGISIFIICFIALIISGFLWSRSSLQVPNIYEKTIITNVNIVDTSSGEVLRKRHIIISCQSEC